MKTIAYFLRIVPISLILILLSSCNQNNRFYLLDGNAHYLSDFSGRWLVINFWAEWCAPCLEEVPALNSLADHEEQLNVIVIGISYDQLSNLELVEIVEKWGIQYSVIATEPVPMLPFSLPPSLPSNYLIDPDGNVAQILVGKQTLDTLKQALIEAKKQYKIDG